MGSACGCGPKALDVADVQQDSDTKPKGPSESGTKSEAAGSSKVAPEPAPAPAPAPASDSTKDGGNAAGGNTTDRAADATEGAQTSDKGVTPDDKKGADAEKHPGEHGATKKTSDVTAEAQKDENGDTPADKKGDDVETHPGAAMNATPDGGSSGAQGTLAIGTVTRKEIRSMPKEDQARFATAVLQMMKNKEGQPESSEYFRLASYHGWDKDYCHHGQETFPGWHRAYLCAFEAALRAADRELGRDGNIGLPYWDWQVDEINGEQFPKVISEFFSEIPGELVSRDVDIKSIGYSQLYSEGRIVRNLRNARLNDQVNRCFQQIEHYMAASTRWRGDSVESPHNSVHVAVGFPMTSVQFAAFHPIFFLHHCNVDRVYERYLQLEPDSQEEMRAMQSRLNQEFGETDRYLQPMAPFKHPLVGGDFYIKDSFDPEKLGFVYDALPPPPPQEMSEAPTFAVFEPIEPAAVSQKAYELHVIVARTGDEEAQLPTASDSDWSELPGYAGWGAVFGGKGITCSNCNERGPFTVLVDVTNALAQSGLRRSQCSCHVVRVGQDGVHQGAPAGVPDPQLKGPYFEGGISEVLAIGSQGADVQALQVYLTKYKFYDGQIDGNFSEATETAVRKFQAYTGLAEDGACGPATKAMILAPRVDTNSFSYEDQDTAVFSPGQELSVFVSRCPGYLQQADVEAEIMQACMVWQTVANISFVKVVETDSAHCIVHWGNRTQDNLFFFDGKGGSLAKTEKKNITLDEAEYWVMQGTKADVRKKKPFQILPVMIHEIGHALGLTHSGDPRDMMSLYYVAGRLTLTETDVGRIKALYP